MKLLVVAAMPQELKSIKQWIKSANLKLNLNIDYLCTWIWNYETIYSLEHYLSLHKEPIFIWNIWVCWYWNFKNEEISNPIQVASIMNIHTEKEIICPPFLELAPFRTCFSSENVIRSFPSSLKKISTVNDEYYFDMESWWIEFISLKYKIPHIILKIPLDLIGCVNSSLSEKSYYNLFKENIAKLLLNLTYKDYLKKILCWIDDQNIM